ncbi:MAG: DeoR/GlpR family DNA-binding transcription regulator [Methylobacteriaceae bacterium]|jgi:DeoR/GlpR family transcriptional regulator of sugar metabolism|nr:DeoR/GlpR family DNA-binding transcription regulator [Methylobacteriaceae bacterium]
MDAEERRAAIARLISENNGADIKMLAERFSVSPMTIRRDRKVLSARNQVSPTHGGAVPVGYLHWELSYAQKADVNLDKKRAIARVAAELVREDTCIILDAGTTTLELARMLMHKRLSVVTVDMRIALLLSQSATVKVFTPGGEVDGDVQCQLDSHARDYLGGVNASLAFVGSLVWDARAGVSCASTAKQAIKRAMIDGSERAILLADSEKYGRCSPWAVARLADFDEIITDDGLAPEHRQAITRAGGVVTVATLHRDEPRPDENNEASLVCLEG